MCSSPQEEPHEWGVSVGGGEVGALECAPRQWRIALAEQRKVRPQNKLIILHFASSTSQCILYTKFLYLVYQSSSIWYTKVPLFGIYTKVPLFGIPSSSIWYTKFLSLVYQVPLFGIPKFLYLVYQVPLFGIPSPSIWYTKFLYFSFI